MILDTHENFQSEHDLLGIDTPRVDDLSSIEIQTRDAVYHYIKSNDQHGEVPVSIQDIWKFIAPIFSNSTITDEETGTIIADAVKSHLEAGNIATYANGERTVCDGIE